MTDTNSSSSAPAAELERQGMLTLDVGTFLRALTLSQLAEHRRQVEDEITRKVGVEAAAGATWDAIGNQLGVTRQAAWSRYQR